MCMYVYGINQSHPTLLVYNHPIPKKTKRHPSPGNTNGQLRAQKKENTLDITKNNKKQDKIKQIYTEKEITPSHQHAASASTTTAATTPHESPDSPDTAPRPVSAPQASY